MQSPDNCFTLFSESVASYSLPERFTFPFCYDPHPLCVLAATELQQHLVSQTRWRHNFGINKLDAVSHDVARACKDDEIYGKMFGVLLVNNVQGELGYLSAFSGKIADQNLLPNFVPPVFNMLAEDGFFRGEQAKISQISDQLRVLESNPKITILENTLAEEIKTADVNIEQLRNQMIAGRKARKTQRIDAKNSLSETEYQALIEHLGKKSVLEKVQSKNTKRYWQARVDTAQQEHDQVMDEITALRKKRKAMSNALQNKLFEQYRFLNIRGEEKNLGTIFKETYFQTPPAGSGECAAPKLLNYAFKHGMQPLALAEFWWGASPKSEVRQHGQFYPACKGKCQPILEHMLNGVPMDPNIMLNNPAAGKDITIVYQDNDMAIINKPAEFLSVPGKNIQDSVYLRMQQMFPKATGPLIVHRLDMSTSGLMVIALTKKANKRLQKQFVNRTVEKRYEANIDGLLKQNEGLISLPLRGDIYDRPRQIVCFEHGKPAETKWQVVEQKNNQTRVHLYPKTGRTHQLRVHCAHAQGLNKPIIGDDLYGKKTKRLHLHAGYLALEHPITTEWMTFEIEADF